jgi:DNA repair protein RadD
VQLRSYQLSLVERIRARFVAGDRSVLAVMPTGAGKTPVVAEIGRRTNDRGNRVLFVAHTTELVTQAVAKFADAGVKAEIEQADKRAGSAPVVVASIASMRGDRLAAWPRDAFALVIHDEAHRTAAATSSGIVDHFSTARLLGVTATPARGDGRALGDAYQTLVIGATIRELTDAGYLVPARVYAPAAEMRAGQTAMTPADAYRNHGNGRAAVIFCASVEHATRVAESMLVPTGVIHGAMPDAERRDTLARFDDGTLTALTCCSVLVEGWDAPRTAVCILARRFGHVGSYLQAIGRVLRPAAGKTHATVIDLCGSAIEHGPPDMEREYSLDGKAIRPSDRLAIRQCPTCGSVSLALVACPECSEPFPVQHRAEPKSANVGVSELGAGMAVRRPWVVMMTAKFPSKCLGCGGVVRRGEQMKWAKGIGSAHPACDLRRAA